MNTEITQLRKKILYRSKKRGYRESEIILGKFIEQYFHEMNNKDLYLLDLLLSYDDNQILGWLQKQETIPSKLGKLVTSINKTIQDE